MLITWYHDYNYQQYYGGAEITDFYWMQSIPKGNLVTECLAGDKLVKADYTIIGNAGSLNEIPVGHYTCIVHSTPFAHLQEIYKNANKLIFVSPEQMKRTGMNGTCIPPFIDGRIYKRQDVGRFAIKRDKKNLYVGRIHELKGLANLIAWSELVEEEVDVYGYGSDEDIAKVVNSKYLNYKGFADQNKVPKLMNEYENFVFFPVEQEGFCRTIIEALLSEMNLIVDKSKIGALSYDWDFTNRDQIQEKLDESIKSFWDTITSMVYR